MTPVELAAKDAIILNPEETPVNTIQASPKAMLKALAQVKPYVATKSSISVLRGVKVTQHAFDLDFETTDMQSYAKATIRPVGCYYGSWVFAHGDLVSALDAMKDLDVVTFTEEKNNVLIEGAGRMASLFFLPVEDFPQPPTRDKLTYEVRFDSEALSEALAWVMPAMSKDETRPIMYGLCLHVVNGLITLVATDTYRLHHEVVPTTQKVDLPDGDYVIHRDGLVGIAPEIKKQPGEWLLEFNVAAEGHTCGGVTFISPDRSLHVRDRLIDGRYPSFRQLIPDAIDGFMVTSSAKELLSVLKPVQKLLKGANAPLHFGILPTGPEASLIVSGTRQDVGSVENAIAVAVERETYSPEGDFHIGFNPDFLVQAVAMAKDTFSMYFLTPLRPAIYFADDPSRQGLIMPIRLND